MSDASAELLVAQRKLETARYNGEAKVELAKLQAQAALAIIQSIQIIVQGYEYRAKLQEIVKTLQADQSMRHADVDFLLLVLEKHKKDMKPATRDEYFRAILKLLDHSTRPSLVLPP